VTAGATGTHGLTAKQARVTVAVVVALSVILSLLEMYFDWHAMRDRVQAQMTQMLDTVSGSAVEAAYQLSPDLSTRVVDGLLGYDVVDAAQLKDNFGDRLAERRRAPETETDHGGLAGWLFGDIAHYQRTLVRTVAANGTTEVGRLEVILSPQTVARGFYDRALINAALILLQSLGIVLLVVGIFYAMITRPLVRLAQVVSGVDPGHPGAGLVEMPPGHASDELGQLVGSLNALLDASQRGLDQRDLAEAGLTTLTHDLERRVADRTRELSAASAEIEALNRILKAENVRLGTELDVSRRIQQMVLPTLGELAAIKGLDVAAHMEPASEVGGDYYDILSGADGRVRIGIGDVTGHGLESGVVMLMTQSAVRTLVTCDESAAVRVHDVLNRTLFDNMRRMGNEKNLTLALLDYHPLAQDCGTGAAGHLTVSGQHESVIVVRRGGRLELFDTIDLGLPLGLVDDVTPFIAETTILLDPGDTVILYTDGITEAADSGNQLYGLERLCDVCVAHWRADSTAIKDAVVADVKRHTGDQPLYDDVTLIVLKQG